MLQLDTVEAMLFNEDFILKLYYFRNKFHILIPICLNLV